LLIQHKEAFETINLQEKTGKKKQTPFELSPQPFVIQANVFFPIIKFVKNERFFNDNSYDE